VSSDLFQWLSQTPGAASHPDLARRLKAAGLDDLHQRLTRGEDLRSPLEQLYQQAAPALRAENLGADALEAQILELADRVDPFSLRTERYQRLALTDPAQLPALESELRSLWGSYAATPVAPEQVTLESVTLHRLLKRAFDSWFLAISCARRGKWEEALGVAEGANALLSALAEAQENFQSITGAAGLDLREESPI
jgi:hypothetical protein